MSGTSYSKHPFNPLLSSSHLKEFTVLDVQLDHPSQRTNREITEESKVQIVPVKAAQAQYYRVLWTHNFVGSSATWNRAVLIDGYVAGVFGLSKMASDSIFVWYVMKVPHEKYRLGRLCYMLAQNKSFFCFKHHLLPPHVGHIV